MNVTTELFLTMALWRMKIKIALMKAFIMVILRFGNTHSLLSVLEFSFDCTSYFYSSEFCFEHKKCLKMLKGSFQKLSAKNMEFSICRGGGSDGVIFHMFSATHQNAFKAILSIFRYFYFFPLWPPLHQKTWIEIFLSVFGFILGKN